MLAFPLVGYMVQQWGWRAAWLAIGVALVAGLAPLAWAVVRRGPEACGLEPDGDARPALPRPTAVVSTLTGYAWTDAIRTPAFWVFAVGTSLYGLVASGIGLFNESILAQRGFGPDIYYQSLVVTAITGLAGNFAGGWLATRVAMGRLMAVSLFVLTAGLVALPFCQPTAGHGVGGHDGIGGGLVMVLFFSVWPRVFGRRHLGRIQGAAQALTVLASAIGPLLLAWCVERTGSYGMMFWILAGIIACVGCAAAVIPMPQRPAH